MRSKFAVTILAATLVISALGAASASAATQAGNNCVGNDGVDGITFVGLSSAPGNPPATIPVSGVISKWTFNVEPIESGFYSQALKIFRATGAPQQYQVIGESAQGSLSSGLNTFTTRIPVRAGDLIGNNGLFFGEPFVIYCETENPADRFGIFDGNPTLGSTATTADDAEGFQIPIVVFIEPDADNDGFGDETQDACPQSAAFQTPCPPVALSTSTQVKKNSVTIIVTSSTAAPVTVKGVAKLGKGKK
ncbi:MAG TPA: hypothetical protein VFS54_02800, partial [Solirubrobacterales bacterium]|nr:hypothetical protein [Solirubrobacterales bacterium]